MSASHDAVVVGSGPNGLAAAITLARAGLRVVVLEAAATAGGGTTSAALTLPGFVHDVCSAIHPMAVLSPFFRTLPLAERGLAWIEPPVPLAHPLDGGTAVTLERGVDATADGLGADAAAWRRLMSPLVASADGLVDDLLGPLHWPRHLAALARFGPSALRPARDLAERRFRTPAARALFAGLAAHSVLPLERAASAAVGLMLAVAGHAVGWPLPRGGAQAIADALAAELRGLGGELRTGAPVASIDELPPARAVLLDLTPRQILRVAGQRLPRRYRAQLARYRYGPGAFKLDWALSAPIPWRAPRCALAGTVHLGGTLEEIAASERAAWSAAPAERPFVLLAQPSRFDPSRAPAGRHTAWAYCHVPHGCGVDVGDRIEAQVERFAPGFRDTILARHVMSPADLERRNPNYVGGDIVGGVQDLGQLFTRPVWRLVPYATPVDGLYVCSASTPPGGGVHGLCGWFAARTALRRTFGRR